MYVHMYIAENFALTKCLPFFFYPLLSLSRVHEYMEPIVTFTAWVCAKFLTSENFRLYDVQYTQCMLSYTLACECCTPK